MNHWYDRLVEERDQLKAKVDRLAEMLNDWPLGQLKFTPKSDYAVFHEQYIYMKNYLKVLDYRVEHEKP